jgi:hypothetical protein
MWVLTIPLGLFLALVGAAAGFLWGLVGGLTGAAFPLPKGRVLRGWHARIAHVCCSGIALAVACEIAYLLPYVSIHFVPQLPRLLTRD